MDYSPQKTFKYSFDAQTEDSQIKAPRPKPLQSVELPPEFKLEEADASWQLQEKLHLGQRGGHWAPRRRSLDMQYSILGFITRKISEKSRQRIMSEQLHNMKL